MKDNLLYSVDNGVLWFFGDQEYEYKTIIAAKDFYAAGKKISVQQLIFPEQTHSNGVIVVDQMISDSSGYSIPRNIPESDALITSRAGLFLTIVTADCIPVLIYDSSKKIVSAVHSGRVGTQMNIAGKTVEQMIKVFQSKVEDIIVLLGPGISTSNYPVSEKIFESFVAETQIEQTYPNLNLKKVIGEQISRIGVQHIQNIDICTFDHPRYFSYRKNKTTQRQISLIGIYQ